MLVFLKSTYTFDEMTAIRVVRSKRDAPAIIVQNYKYTRSKTLNSGDVIWMCPMKTCYASIKTNDQIVILESRGVHKHHSLSSYDIEKLEVSFSLAQLYYNKIQLQVFRFFFFSFLFTVVECAHYTEIVLE